jgi:hypothetical protein
MLYLTSQFFGLGSGTLTYMKGGRDEDDDGAPAATLDAKPACQAMAAVGNSANKKQKRQIHEHPSFFQTQMTPEHPEASTLELSHAR